MRLFQDLVTIPKRCVYALVNERDKKAYIAYSSNTLGSICNLISSNKLQEDWSKLQIKILETIQSSNKLKIRYQHWTTYYANNGYRLYRDYKAVQYKLSIDVIEDHKRGVENRLLFIVRLVSRGYKSVTVGVFGSMEEMNEFIRLHYTVIDDIVCADNELTKKYLASVKS